MGLVSCTTEQTSQQYPLALRVFSDPGKPLPGALVRQNGNRVGESATNGLVDLSPSGTQGESVTFDVTCPPGHGPATNQVSILLQRLAEPTKRPEYSVYCPPAVRTVVVAVRAENGPDLPVVYLGRERARTDRDGAAHLVLQAPAEEALELTLDTSSNPYLHPQNPSARFRVGHQDQLFVLGRKFYADPPKKRLRTPRRGPVLIQREH